MLFTLWTLPIADAEKVSTVDIEGWSQGLFLHEDTIVVASQVYDGDFYGTKYTFFDITDRSNPVETRNIYLEGYRADARLIENDMYFVLNHWLSLPSDAWNLAWDDSPGLPDVDWSLSDEALEADIEDKREQVREILEPVITTMVSTWDLDELFAK